MSENLNALLYALESRSELTIAQFSDCHLYADQQAIHYGANVYQNLVDVLSVLSNNTAADFMVFTGDLSQDHSLVSYQNFLQAVRDSGCHVPMVIVAGNHDDPKLLTQQLATAQFYHGVELNWRNWQLFFLNSKSETPAGKISQQQLKQLEVKSRSTAQQLLFMHHHPIEMGYFIDRHGLESVEIFWQGVAALPNVQAIACGHVHRGQEIMVSLKPTAKTLKVLTCPATSIQFDPSAPTIKALPQSAGYRLIHLHADGNFSSSLHYL